MRRISYYIMSILLGATFLTGCFEDKSGTAFSAEEVITITGIENSYIVEARVQTLPITPTVTSNKDAEWEYRWEYYEPSEQGDDCELIPITKNKDLSQTFDLAAKKWVLVFGAKNIKTGYEKLISSTLTVVTSFTSGWYVLKDDGTNSDFNFYPVKEGFVPGNLSQPKENILAGVNGKGMVGKAKKFQMASNFSLLNSEGIFEKKKVFMVITEDDFGVYTVEDMKNHRNRDNLGFEPWPVIKPDFCYETGLAILFSNDGHYYSINTLYSNNGLFGTYMTIGAEYDYSLSKYIAIDEDVPMMFDEASSSFIAMNYFGEPEYCQNDYETEVNARRNNLTCLYFASFKSKAIGLFADKTTGEKSILSMYKDSYLSITKLANVNSSSELDRASTITISPDEEVLYFVNDKGDVWSRMLNASGTEALEFDVPSDETITFIRPLKQTIKDVFTYNYIMVATVKGSGVNATYTVRFFKKLGGRFDGEDEKIRLTGKGYARDVNFMHPSTEPFTMHAKYIYL